jgi:lipopolysaccharide cholinephosphotransferase
MVPINLDVPEAFLREEVRSDYLVSKQMKEIWAVELDLLAQFQKVCDQYGIRYYACGGTLLGAVRHDGFIPWDDDIDITMLREDYEKLISHWDAFPAPYLLQFFGKEEGYLTGHAQLRNTSTTAILNMHLNGSCKIPYDQSIFIDIFPLDAVPDDPVKRRKLIRKLSRYWRLSNKLYCITEGYIPEKAGRKKKILHHASHLVPKRYSYAYFHQKYLEACQTYNHEKTEYVSMLSFRPTDEKLYIRYENLLDAQPHPFEFLSINIEKNYDAVLKLQYGAYQKPVKCGCYHGGILFDTNQSYQQWMMKHR